MHFFHLSDLHIGKQLYGYSLLEDQEWILTEIYELIREKRPDGVLIAGDVYDKSVPAAEAVTVFDQSKPAGTEDSGADHQRES